MKTRLQLGLAVVTAGLCLAQTCLAQTPVQIRRLNQLHTQGSHSPSVSLRNARHALDDQATVQPASPSAPPAWTPLGPFGISSPQGAVAGRVTAIVTDSRSPNLAYLAAAGGGIWRTSDAGNSWQSLGDNLLSMSSGTLVLDQRFGAQGALYYGTGDYTGSTYGPGILRSTDGGKTWQELSTQFESPNGETLRIALHPTDPQTLFLARDSGVWRSSDGGNSWSNVLPGFATDVVISQNAPNLLFAALGYPVNPGAKYNGVYRSIDGGNTWQIVNALPTGVPVGRISLALTPASPGTVVALMATSGDYSLDGLFRSDDFGATWRPLNITSLLFFSNTYGYNRGWFEQVLTIDPANVNNIYVGGEQLYRSQDGGQTFLPLTLDGNGQPLIHEGMFGMAFQPGSLNAFYVATEGGIYRTDAGGQVWFNLNQSLPIAQIDAVAVNPGSSTILAAGESNGLMSLSGELSTWTQLLRGNTGAVFFDPFQSGYLYGGQVAITPLRSTDGGATWNQKSSGISSTDPTGYDYYYAPYLADPNLAGNLLFGTTRVWRSTNQGTSWTAVSPQLATPGNNLTVIAVTPGSGRTYAATSDGRVWASADGATNWQQGSGLPLQYISTLAADPSSPLRAYLGVWGYLSGHVFRTLDGGVSWQDISGGLPDIPVNAIVVDPRGPVYAASDIGVFRYTNGGWSSFSQALPNTLVTSLALDASSSRLIAGTFGRGAYQINVPPPGSNGPAIEAAGIVDAASGFTIVSPGSVALIYGSNLTDVTGQPVVKVNGVSAQLQFASATQINFLMPSGLAASEATVTVTTLNGSTGALVQTAPAAPGIYAGSGVQHSNGTQVTAANPAHAGETVTLTASGLGDPAAGPIAPVVATINGVPAEVPFAGPGATAQGVFQVNVTVPSGVLGDLPLLISSGPRVSNPVTISIR